MNHVFYEYLDQFVIVYLDGIVVYSTTLEEHKVHLKLVFDKLQQNQLYVKKEKCAFTQTCINFLGHVISCGQIGMDSDKIKAIQEWKVPTVGFYVLKLIVCKQKHILFSIKLLLLFIQ